MCKLSPNEKDLYLQDEKIKFSFLVKSHRCRAANLKRLTHL